MNNKEYINVLEQDHGFIRSNLQDAERRLKQAQADVDRWTTQSSAMASLLARVEITGQSAFSNSEPVK